MNTEVPRNLDELAPAGKVEFCVSGDTVLERIQYIIMSNDLHGKVRLCAVNVSHDLSRALGEHEAVDVLPEVIGELRCRTLGIIPGLFQGPGVGEQIQPVVPRFVPVDLFSGCGGETRLDDPGDDELDEFSVRHSVLCHKRLGLGHKNGVPPHVMSIRPEIHLVVVLGSSGQAGRSGDRCSIGMGVSGLSGIFQPRLEQGGVLFSVMDLRDRNTYGRAPVPSLVFVVRVVSESDVLPIIVVEYPLRTARNP